MTTRVVARRDEALSARVLRSVALRYVGGADRSVDRPAHVRAGSGIAWWGGRLAVVQDDANFLALVDPASGLASAIVLPAGRGGLRQFDDGRGNKADKLDLESLVHVPGVEGGPLLLALGSGTTPRRESIVMLREGPAGAPLVEVRDASALYARLRDAMAFSGSELNVEGAVYVDAPPGPRLRLFNRGNGAPSRGLLPVNATCDIDWRALRELLAQPAGAPAPAPRDVVRYDLGAIDGLPLTFTDATIAPAAGGAAGGRIIYIAAAEASPDVTRDGPVSGCAVGIIEEAAGGVQARWAPLCDAAGQPFVAKIEGIVLRTDDPSRAWVVIDRDASDVPSELCDVALEGAWHPAA